MNNSEFDHNNDGPSRPSIFAKYRGGIFLLAVAALSLIIAFFLARGFQNRGDIGTRDLPSTTVTSAPSATPASHLSPMPPISPVSPISASPPASKAVEPISIEDLAETGVQLYKRGNYEEALEIFNTIVEAEPDNPVAYDIRGSIYAALEAYEDALKDYDQAIELDPSLAQAYYNRGRVYSLLKRYDEALSDLEKSVQLDSRNFGYRAKGNIGLIYHRMGEYEKASEAFEAAISYDDTKADVFYLKGETYTALEDYQAAINDYEAAIARFPGYDAAYASLGYAYYKTDQYDKAAEALNHALEISPDSPAAHSYLALVHLATDDVESAKTEVSRLASSFSTLPQEEQELVYARAVGELKAFAQENTDKAAEVDAIISLIPQPD